MNEQAKGTYNLNYNGIDYTALIDILKEEFGCSIGYNVVSDQKDKLMVDEQFMTDNPDSGYVVGEDYLPGVYDQLTEKANELEEKQNWVYNEENRPF